jgi:hypothetical protein
MFLTELFTNEDEKLDELDPGFVNDEIVRQRQPFKHQQAWERKGRGATASVWEHYSDPTTVVKVVGGGDYESFRTEREVTLAFVHFLVDHGHQSKHFPIVYGINIDDSEVLQVRIEKLVPIPDVIADVLGKFRWYADSAKGLRVVAADLKKVLPRYPKYYAQNKVEDLVAAVSLLNRGKSVYAKAHGLGNVTLDLHAGNWLARPDGTIIAADPWYDESSENVEYRGYGDSDDLFSSSDERSFSGDSVATTSDIMTTRMLKKQRGS